MLLFSTSQGQLWNCDKLINVAVDNMNVFTCRANDPLPLSIEELVHKNPFLTLTLHLSLSDWLMRWQMCMLLISPTHLFRLGPGTSVICSAKPDTLHLLYDTKLLLLSSFLEQWATVTPFSWASYLFEFRHTHTQTHTRNDKIHTVDEMMRYTWLWFCCQSCFRFGVYTS